MTKKFLLYIYYFMLNVLQHQLECPLVSASRYVKGRISDRIIVM